MKGRQWFPPSTYFIIDNWFYTFKVKNGREPTFEELVNSCIERGLLKLGIQSVESLRSLYKRLLRTPNPVIEECLGVSGHCAPLAHYRNNKPFYMSYEAYEALSRHIEKVIKRRLNFAHTAQATIR